MLRKVLRTVVTVSFLPFAAALWILRIRFFWITNLDRIGHLAAEPDAYLKQSRMGMLGPHLGIFVAPLTGTVNQSLLALWTNILPSVTNPKIVRLLFVFWRFRFLWIDSKQYVAADFGQPATYYEILSRWEGRSPIIRTPQVLAEKGRAVLARLGLPADAWFVCLHVREAGYSPRDDQLHEYRNCSIENYWEAVEEVVGRGGWCIRMGDGSTTPLRFHPRVIDYAHSPECCDWMDIFLCAECRLFLGTTSGLIMVPTIFGRRTVTTNFVPISRPPVSPSGLGIPKLLQEKETGRLLTFEEVVQGEGTMSYTNLNSIPGIAILENRPEEIRQAVAEALDELDGKIIFEEPDIRRQERFLSIYPEGHFASKAKSRISPSFLRKYEALLPPG